MIGGRWVKRRMPRRTVVELGFGLDAAGGHAGQFDLRGDGPYR